MTSELMTVNELAAFLKMSKRSIYELTRKRVRDTQDNPMPLMRINGNLRVRRQDIEIWLESLVEKTK